MDVQGVIGIRVNGHLGDLTIVKLYKHRTGDMR